MHLNLERIFSTNKIFKCYQMLSVAQTVLILIFREEGPLMQVSATYEFRRCAFYDIISLSWHAIIYCIFQSYFNILIFNSSPPHTHTHTHTQYMLLVQIMACRLFGTKPWSKPMLGIVNSTLRNKLKYFFFLIKIQNFSSTKLHLKMSVEWRIF